MNRALKWKLLAGFLLAFLAGAATGGFFAARQSHHHHSDRDHHRPSFAERMRDRMQTRLALTPEQIEKTAPIFDRAAAELEQIRRETGRQVKQVMSETNRAMLPELTEAQRNRLSAMEKSGRGGHGPHPRSRRHGERGAQTPAQPTPDGAD